MKYPEKEVLDLIKKVVEVNSIYDPTTVSATDPYGRGVSAAFDVIGDFCRAEKIGFTIYNNRVMEIIFGNPEAQKSFGILAHIDVVPINDWKEGFQLKIENGNIYGRGVCDDKGPLVVNLIALKNFYQNNREKIDNQDFNIKFIIGGDEERGSSCLEYYFEELKKPPLTFGYTPDAEFPVVYGEKGMLGAHIHGKYPIKALQSITVINATNVVPNKVSLVFDRNVHVEKVLLNNNLNIEYTYQVNGDQIDVVVHGKSAHASLSRQGKNAIYHTIRLINEVSPNPLFSRLLEIYPNDLGINFDPFDEGIKTELGEMTFNLGRMSYVDETLTYDIDIRFNERCDIQKFIHYIEINNAPLQVNVGRIDQPLIVDKNSPFIKTLLRAYQEGSGDTKSKPMTKGGGTYAKHAKNVVAFGPEIEGIDNHIHEDHEVISLKSLEMMYHVYALAIEYLVELLHAD